MSYHWLKGRTVVLSGASGGFGRALTKCLVEKEGCFVVGIGQSEAKMRQLQVELGENAGQFIYRLFDVSSKKNWTTFCSWLQEQDIRPCLLINSAGVLPHFSQFMAQGSQVLEQVMRVNFLSCVYACEVLLPVLKEQQMSGIVNVISSAALSPIVGAASYSASKAALKGFTEALREELRDTTYVGAVFPGFSLTDIFRKEEISASEHLLRLIATPPEKIAKKMERGISRRKARMVLGLDAKFMHLFTNCFPTLSLRFYRWILKKSRLPLFEDVF